MQTTETGTPRRPSPGRASTRTRPRWQPYNPQNPTSPAPYLNTPHSSSSSNSSSFLQETPAQDKSTLSLPNPPRESSSRDAKTKYAAGLVDMAVKTITDGWPLEVIPLPYRSPALAPVQSLKPAQRQTQIGAGPTTFTSTLPSPVTPTTSPSTFTASSPKMPAVIDEGMKQSHATQLRSFVTEVVRRSKTSGCVLQAATCYLEGLKAQIPELMRKEALGVRDDIEGEDRITFEPSSPSGPREAQEDNDAATPADIPTIRLTDSGSIDDQPGSPAPMQPTTETHLPCPLLCPRRSFLAALILASKFLQDKSYSNRAWAKLSGLPAREISRCERGLGRALDWRLWVGKTCDSLSAPSGVSNSSPVSAKRSLGRCASESAVFTPPSTLSAAEPTAIPIPVPKISSKATRTLSRSRTVPAAVYSGQTRHEDFNHIVPGSKEANAPISVEAEYRNDDVMMQDATTPPTPGLTYSPSSSESSYGDRTVQMSAYPDMPSTNASDCWSWPDAPEGSTREGAHLGKLSPLDKRSFLVPQIGLTAPADGLHKSQFLAFDPVILEQVKMSTVQHFQAVYGAEATSGWHPHPGLNEIAPV